MKAQSKTVLLTGSLGGIGQATLHRLIQAGYLLAATYAEGIENVNDIQKLADKFPGKVSIHALDLRYPESIMKCFLDAQQYWGSIDILVNNAAVGSATVSHYASNLHQQDALLLDINANGALIFSQLFIEHLKSIWAATGKATSAKLINIASVGGGLAAFPHFRLADGMSKAALAFMTRQLAAEHVHTPLDVFALCPGATNTGMFQASTLATLSMEERDKLIANLPKQRLIEPDEIAELIAFLAGPYSTPMHGAIIDASMGLASRPGLLTEHH
ncbi:MULTISPECIES: SDR family NAD(P)-dependent oxidoreductase [unclassified Serratia (in: enterobacteria)]|uniref:SDR family NAD(P)-dependent oxidoreductase n=1 Tax=unclassified Serratia (in: enterobacteria) TaxID=2647522 RepID=UPI0004697396|nr:MULTISPECIES: SDR family oxidoreductase [unclassified Serratia (in: enterobacteria)]